MTKYIKIILIIIVIILVYISYNIIKNKNQDSISEINEEVIVDEVKEYNKDEVVDSTNEYNKEETVIPKNYDTKKNVSTVATKTVETKPMPVYSQPVNNNDFKYGLKYQNKLYISQKNQIKEYNVDTGTVKTIYSETLQSDDVLQLIKIVDNKLIFYTSSDNNPLPPGGDPIDYYKNDLFYLNLDTSAGVKNKYNTK